MFQPGENRLDITGDAEGVQVITPVLNDGHRDHSEEPIKALLAEWNKQYSTKFIAWFYTPMALPLLGALEEPAMVIYDCMDELSAFRFAPPSLKENERLLMEQADIVFTGGVSLYEVKKELHDNVHAFPSSIDREHFAGALEKGIAEPHDQSGIPHPRVGFFGVIDERFDIELIGELARKRPDLQIILLGPVVKIDEGTLPRADNLHYRGSKTYNELPQYLAGWDVALIPFAINESTRFISPTKTPEYLAGGVPVVSTPIRDVVTPYGINGLVHIASNATEFSDAIDEALTDREDEQWVAEVDRWLNGISWDKTAQDMLAQIELIVDKKSLNPKKKEGLHV